MRIAFDLADTLIPQRSDTDQRCMQMRNIFRALQQQGVGVGVISGVDSSHTPGEHLLRIKKELLAYGIELSTPSISIVFADQEGFNKADAMRLGDYDILIDNDERYVENAVKAGHIAMHVRG